MTDAKANFENAKGTIPPATAAASSSDTVGLNEKEKPVSLKPRFTGLATRFDGFEQQLERQKRKKKEDIDEKISALHEKIAVLQNTIVLEKKNQAQAMQALQKWLDARVTESMKMEDRLVQKIEVLDKKVDTTFVRIDEVRTELVKSISKFPRMIEERSAELLEEIKDFNTRFDQGQRERRQREDEILVDVVKQGDEIRKKIEVERVAREKRDKEIALEIDKEVQIRAKGLEIVKRQLADEVVEIKADIVKEIKAREAADDELVQVINHYAAALQDSIKVVAADE